MEIIVGRIYSAREEQGGSYIFSQNAQILWRVTNPMRHPKTMTKNKKFRFFCTSYA